MTRFRSVLPHSGRAKASLGGAEGGERFMSEAIRHRSPSSDQSWSCSIHVRAKLHAAEYLAARFRAEVTESTGRDWRSGTIYTHSLTSHRDIVPESEHSLTAAKASAYTSAIGAQ